VKEITSGSKENSGRPAESSAFSCKIHALSPEHCCTILESIGEAIATIDLDKTVTYINPAAEALTGYPTREGVGRKCFDVFRTNVCEKRCPLDETLKSGDPQFVPRTPLINRSGRTKTISIYTSLLRTEENDVVGAVESFRDLSELEQLRRQLSRSFTHEDIIGNHPRMKEILYRLPDIAESESRPYSNKGTKTLIDYNLSIFFILGGWRGCDRPFSAI